MHLRVQHIPLIHFMGLMTFFEKQIRDFGPLLAPQKKFGGFSSSRAPQSPHDPPPPHQNNAVTIISITLAGVPTSLNFLRVISTARSGGGGGPDIHPWHQSCSAARYTHSAAPIRRVGEHLRRPRAQQNDKTAHDHKSQGSVREVDDLCGPGVKQEAHCCGKPHGRCGTGEGPTCGRGHGVGGSEPPWQPGTRMRLRGHGPHGGFNGGFRGGCEGGYRRLEQRWGGNRWESVCRTGKGGQNGRRVCAEGRYGALFLRGGPGWVCGWVQPLPPVVLSFQRRFWPQLTGTKGLEENLVRSFEGR